MPWSSGPCNCSTTQSNALVADTYIGFRFFSSLRRGRAGVAWALVGGLVAPMLAQVAGACWCASNGGTQCAWAPSTSAPPTQQCLGHGDSGTPPGLCSQWARGEGGLPGWQRGSAVQAGSGAGAGSPWVQAGAVVAPECP